MNIRFLLDTFNILDKNGDDILSNEELKNSSFKNTIWTSIIQPDVSINDFIIQGLSIENSNTTNNTSLSGFDIQHAKLAKQNIHPIKYSNDYCMYENSVMLYTKDVETYDDIPQAPTENVKNARGVDISKLSLTEEQLLNLVIDDYTTMNDEQKILLEKAKANTNQMGCGIEKLHQDGYDGYGRMALLDQKYCGHSLYNDKVIDSTDIGKNINNNETPSWHTAAMLSIMNKTAPKAEIRHYYVTNEDTEVQDEQFAEAIRDIIEKNKSLPENEKIRTIVMGWGFYQNNPKYEEYISLCKEAIDNGIFISSNNYSELYGIELFGTDRKPLADVNNADSYTLANWQDKTERQNIPKEILDSKFLGVPMQHLTIGSIDGTTLQYEGSDGGLCWANSVGALYNDFICVKSDLKPQEFINLLIEGADELTIDGIYCGRLLNAEKSMGILKSNM